MELDRNAIPRIVVLAVKWQDHRKWHQAYAAAVVFRDEEAKVFGAGNRYRTEADRHAERAKQAHDIVDAAGRELQELAELLKNHAPKLLQLVPIVNFFDQAPDDVTPWLNAMRNIESEILARAQGVIEQVTPRRTSEEPHGQHRDDDAYVPAAILRNERLDEFARADQLTRFLESVNRERIRIRTKKPSRNRLLIHAGDWHAYFAARSNPLDLPCDVIDQIARVDARTQQERKKRLIKKQRNKPK